MAFFDPSRALISSNLSDALASVAVIVGGILIILYDMRWVDPAITIGIAIHIHFPAISEIGGPARTLMLGSPPDIDSHAVVTAMLQQDCVEDVHHVHLWQMQENAAALDAHVVLDPARLADVETIKAAVKAVLADDFAIRHSTLEIENGRQDVCTEQVFEHGRADGSG